MAIFQPLVTELHSFSLIQYGLEGSGGDRRWEPHLHSFHQFDLTTGGSSALEFDGGVRLPAEPGTGILVPPMVRHNHCTQTGFNVAMFKFNLAPGGWAPLGPRPIRLTISPETVAVVRAAGAAHAAQTVWWEQQAAAALTLCLTETLRAIRAAQVVNVGGAAPTETGDGTGHATVPGTGAGTSGGASDGFAQVLAELLEAIEAAPLEPWTVAGLAARCHLTADHFTKRFRAALAIGPQEYLLKARMRAAARALGSDATVSIKAVAEAAGYASVHGFSRAFRQVTGVSPGRYRRQSGDL